MAHKREVVAKLGIKRKRASGFTYLYYVKNGSLWRLKMRGRKKVGKAQLVRKGVVKMDKNYLYFLDKKGNISRVKRKMRGRRKRRKK